MADWLIQRKGSARPFSGVGGYDPNRRERAVGERIGKVIALCAFVSQCSILHKDTAWLIDPYLLELHNSHQQGKNGSCVILSGREQKFASKGSDPRRVKKLHPRWGIIGVYRIKRGSRNII